MDAGHTIEGAKSRDFDCGIAVLQAHWTLRRTRVNVSHIHQAEDPAQWIELAC